MLTPELEIREYPEHPLLGRKIAVLDQRSRQFAAVGAIVGEDRAPRTKTWRTYPRAFDQGRTPQCTIYTGKRIVNSQPLRRTIPREVRLNLDTTKFYNFAQTIDEWPGTDYDGTSCLAAAKTFKRKGLINGYRWCFGLEDVLKTVSWYGPVAIGISWYESMFTPKQNGMLVVNEKSGLAGGHAVAIIGLDVDKKIVKISNSWGEDWGNRGRCYMSFNDLDRLLRDWGEALTYL